MNVPCRNFRMSKPDRLIWRDWGEQSVVFDVLSGETHLFDVVTAAAIQFFEEGVTVDAQKLAEKMADRLELEVDAELESFLCRAIDGAIAVGLVEVVGEVESR